jgi:hypothetical protein
VSLLSVHQSRERAVLPFQEDAREDQDVHQEPRVALAEAKVHERRDAARPDALPGFRPDPFQHKMSSATRGSNPRPPVLPLLPPQP